MNPLQLKEKWQLTYSQLAAALGYESDYSVRSWAMQGKKKRNPPGVVTICCKLLDAEWERNKQI
jgi:hypothetical protein